MKSKSYFNSAGTLISQIGALNKHSLLMALCLVMSSLYGLVFAQDLTVYKTDDVIVTASRIPMTLSELSRSVTIISHDEIENFPVNSIPDLLEYVVGVDVKQRGQSGVQADIGIRGSTFEQTLVLINGFKVNDPQTGHHNLDLPFTLDDIQRIEILKGQGSRLYGPDAFGGVINIITKKGRNKLLNFKSAVGDFKYFDGGITLSRSIRNTGHHLSVARKKSDGYTRSTDFDISTAYYGGTVKLKSGSADFSAGYTDKKFGANNFYSNMFPDEWEHTRTIFLSAGLDTHNEKFSFSRKLYWRNHEDDFILDNTRPDWYRNKHTTNTYGVEFEIIFKSSRGITSIGNEIGRESIKSSSLGDHQRNRVGIFLEHKVVPIAGLTIIPGVSAYHYTSWDWKFWPAISIAYNYTDNLRLFGSAGFSFRVPTFTDLYYDSPANKGNPDLQPEKAVTYEIGMSWTRHSISVDAAIFRRTGHDLIDWVRANSNDPWQVMNVSQINTDGIELDFEYKPEKTSRYLHLRRIGVGYSFLYSDRNSNNYESKYILNQLKHQISLAVDHDIIGRLHQGWRFRYEDPASDDDRFLLDLKIFWKSDRIELYVESTNIFNTEYVDAGYIPVPGRQVRAGLKVNLYAELSYASYNTGIAH